MSFPQDLFSGQQVSQKPDPPTGTTCSRHDPASVLETLTPLIDATINRLNRKRFLPDPIAGEHFSRIVSVMSSAYKRHGHILERAVLEQLKRCPDLQVWTDPIFQVPANADLLANGSLADPSSIVGNEVNYGAGARTIQVDAIVFDRRNNSLRAYEVKRGFGSHDAGKRRSILRDILCLHVLLKSYGRARGVDAASISAHVVFYYGIRSIPRPFSLIGSELDEHFGWPVQTAVEEVNQHFKSRLFAILAG
jgi:hypothetical protein